MGALRKTYGRKLLVLLCASAALCASGVRGVDAEAPVRIDVPLLANRWCPASPLKLYGTDELSPADLHRAVRRGSWIIDVPVLKISSSFEPDSCSTECKDRVSMAVAQSLNLWRHLCLRCKPG